MSDAAGLRGHAQEPSGVCLRATGGRDRTGAAGEIPTTPQASTACKTVGRMGEEATRRLTVVLGTEASEVLRAAASSRNREADSCGEHGPPFLKVYQDQLHTWLVLPAHPKPWTG
jgi:hypothetical protein